MKEPVNVPNQPFLHIWTQTAVIEKGHKIGWRGYRYESVKWE
jgi:hypothetical protein